VKVGFGNGIKCLPGRRLRVAGYGTEINGTQMYAVKHIKKLKIIIFKDFLDVLAAPARQAEPEID
jgi:hypothetical protein